MVELPAADTICSKRAGSLNFIKNYLRQLLSKGNLCFTVLCRNTGFSVSTQASAKGWQAKHCSYSLRDFLLSLKYGKA